MEQKNFKNQSQDGLLISYIIGSTSDNERDEVNEWLASSIENKLYFDQISDLYFLGKVTKKQSGFNREQSLERVKFKYYKAKYEELFYAKKLSKKNHFKLSMSIAATFIVTIGLSLLFQLFAPSFKNQDTHFSSFNTITAPKGSKTELTLPDGTKVWLNADSRISYPVDFFNGDRIVTLSGEAFFDVTKFKGKRFIVKTSAIVLNVLGTKFNVKAYPNEKTIKTTLIEGLVSITSLRNDKNEPPILLKPNQTAVYYKDKKVDFSENNPTKPIEPYKKTELVYIEQKVNTILHTSWKDEKWVIDGESLGNLAIELERRYNVIIEFENESIKKYTFNGILANESLEQVLNIIKISAPINFIVINSQVLIKENKVIKNKYDKYLKQQKETPM